jgi:hypothetical protein
VWVVWLVAIEWGLRTGVILTSNPRCNSSSSTAKAIVEALIFGLG